MLLNGIQTYWSSFHFLGMSWRTLGSPCSTLWAPHMSSFNQWTTCFAVTAPWVRGRWKMLICQEETASHRFVWASFMRIICVIAWCITVMFLFTFISRFRRFYGSGFAVSSSLTGRREWKLHISMFGSSMLVRKSDVLLFWCVLRWLFILFWPILDDVVEKFDLKSIFMCL